MAHDPRLEGSGKVEVIGHRGAALLAPENTLAAVVAALDAGADGVEIDVRMSADGTLVVIHDLDVERTTGGSGRVDALTADECGSLGVPTLKQILDRVPVDKVVIVEMKGTPWEAGHDPTEPVARAVAELLGRMSDRRIVVSSFNPMALAVVRERAPGLRTGVLTASAFDPRSNLAAAIDGGHEECHVPAALLTEGFVAEAHGAGRRVVAWTVDEPEELRRFAAWGVDAVIADDPGAARRAFGRSG